MSIHNKVRHVLNLNIGHIPNRGLPNSTETCQIYICEDLYRKAYSKGLESPTWTKTCMHAKENIKQKDIRM